MVKIRLTQTGSANRKTYRIVAIEEGKRRDGRAIEILGFYNPLVKPAHIELKRDRIAYWITNGAQTSEAVKKLLEEPKS
ncbi:30S ribosomal protein S16 [Candidatus Gottesmanbacteria bacterium]|nr:30S ribosomal protein S16 [Candidatus Gottesmanbacteria bacterium]